MTGRLIRKKFTEEKSSRKILGLTRLQVSKKKYLTLDHSSILVLGIDVPTHTPENDGSGAVSNHIRHLFSTRDKILAITRE